ncbi:MAG: hypothetical protein GF421_05980 [Candidatus Aminicenantes bacterium]|nr:hypothetical protein [Candidatus Aminicenantes bacterium]
MNKKNTSKIHYRLKDYREILEALKNNFNAHYVLSEIPQIFSQIMSPKFIIRHDVHDSLKQGLELARIEKEYSIRSSFMICPLSPHFNLKLNDNLSQLKEILDLGHEIGLYIHHTSSFIKDQTTGALNKNEIMSQCRHLESLIKQKVRSVSFPKEFSRIPEDSFFILQKVSASSKKLMEGALIDNTHDKQHKEIMKKITRPQNKIVQILIHPELWHQD